MTAPNDGSSTESRFPQPVTQLSAASFAPGETVLEHANNALQILAVLWPKLPHLLYGTGTEPVDVRPIFKRLELRLRAIADLSAPAENCCFSITAAGQSALEQLDLPSLEVES